MLDASFVSGKPLEKPATSAQTARPAPFSATRVAAPAPALDEDELSKLIVTNLSPTTNDESLRQTFASCGNVLAGQVTSRLVSMVFHHLAAYVRRGEDGVSKCTGVVIFSKPAEALLASDALDGIVRPRYASEMGLMLVADD